MLTAAAVGIVIIGGGVTAFNAQQKIVRHAERQMTLASNARLALEIMESDLANVGYRWPVQAASFIVYDNLNAPGAVTTQLDGGATLNCPLMGTCTGAIQGSDVFELFSGDPNRRQGFIVAASGGAGVTNVPVTFLADMGLTAADVNGLMLFVNNDNSWCVGEIASVTPGTVPTATITAPPNTIPNFPGATNVSTCIQAQASAYILNQRRRYMIYQNAGGANFGLYSQTANETGILGAPQLVMDGIENLQVKWLMSNAPTATNPLACPGLTPPALCWCDDVTSSAACDATLSPSLIRAAQIQVTARGGDSTQWDIVPGAFLPASYNSPAGAVDLPTMQPPSGYTRVQLKTSYFFWNFGTTWMGQ